MMRKIFIICGDVERRIHTRSGKCTMFLIRRSLFIASLSRNRGKVGEKEHTFFYHSPYILFNLLDRGSENALSTATVGIRSPNFLLDIYR